jgi:D-alanine transaminase
MERISFLNGEFLPHNQCFVHIEDRGFGMADGVYEVILLQNNQLIDFNWHLARLFRSLDEMRIELNKSKDWLKQIIAELIAKNNLVHGSVYLQITRGVSSRQQLLPQDYVPTIVITVLPSKNIHQKTLRNGLSVITHQDIRWEKCNIKSIALFANSWIRQKAIESGADDAILVRDNYVTESTFANVFIVDSKNNLVTRDADNFILCGITRNRIIDLAKKNDINVLEKKFTLKELLTAKEVFLSSSTLLIRPIYSIDQQIIGSGKIGEFSKKLMLLYNEFINQPQINEK